MKNLLILFIITLLSAVTVHAQNSYEVTFATEYEDVINEITKGYQDEFIVVRYKSYWAGIYDTAEIARFTLYSFYNNIEDSLCWPVAFYRPDTNIFPQKVYFDNNCYYVFGSAVTNTSGPDSLLTRWEYMARFDMNKQIVWEKLYPRPAELTGYLTSGGPRILKLISGNLLVLTGTSMVENPLYNRWLLREYSTGGNVLKERVFSHYLTGYVQSLTYSFDSTEILIHNSTGGHIPGCNNLETAGHGALILDTATYDTVGGVCYLPDINIHYPYEAMFDHNGHLILSGYTTIYDFDQHKFDEYIGTYILNSDFQVINSRLLTDKDRKTWFAYNEGMDIDENGNIFIAGEVDWVPDFFPQSYDYIYLAKMDSNLNVLTERYLGGDSFYGIMSMITTTDGGVALGGYKYDYTVNDWGDNDAFLIKTDADLMVGTNEHASIPVHSALVYPNPGTGTMNIRTTEKGGVLRLYNLSGKQMLQKKISDLITGIDCSTLTGGVYVWKLYKNNREIDYGKWIKL